jgi:cobyrinic acid a,c-diamide synthase
MIAGDGFMSIFHVGQLTGLERCSTVPPMSVVLSAALNGFIVAAPATGSGKTLITMGLIRALARGGRKIAAFKTGPDYIDPAFHSAALGTDRACINLDGWAMDDAMLALLLGRHAAGAELLVGEGVMGLFDGARGLTGQGDGSTADLAGRLGLPVILVVDAKGQGASLAALVEGFARHRADLPIAGVILNRLSGATHETLLRDALAPLDLPVLGALPQAPDLALPSRHLGLVQARETADLGAVIERAGDLVARHVDLTALAELARPAVLATPAQAPLVPPLGQRIAVARDDAFAFAYPALLDGWRRTGSELSFFSPLADEAPEAHADAIYLPGGYPELQAGRLAGNTRLLQGLRAAAAQGRLIYGECGGYMLLGQSLTDAAGETHAMAGLLGLATSFAARKLHLGYRQAALTADAGPLGTPGTVYRGHEFHYASVLREDGDALFTARTAAGAELGRHGLRHGAVMGSFIHLIARR